MKKLFGQFVIASSYLTLLFLASCKTPKENAANPSAPNAQSTFLVKTGETRTVANNERRLLVDKFIMEDNSTIVLADDISLWEVTALDLQFGKGCKIIGDGASGSNGDHGGPGGHAGGGDCSNGGHGGNGQPGVDGKPGKNIKIKAGIRQLGHVLIDLNGGNGGEGGNGGNGGNGTQGDCSRSCNGGAGGNGGNGGRNGNGGPGGSFELSFWVIDGLAGNIDLNGNGTGIQLTNKGGIGGNSGVGGSRGSGGPGKKCPGKNREPGPHGSAGTAAAIGTTGKSGAYSTIVVPKP